MIQKAVVIGVGIGGLCTAVALRQIGVDVTVYEKAEAIGQVGAGLTLWPNALGVLRQLNLAEEIIQAVAAITEAQIRTANGRILACSRPGEWAEPTIAIHRAELHRILLAALPPVHIDLV